MQPTQIRANTVLPARRDPITLHTPDGLALVGELARPEAKKPVATLLCLHPLPTAGGMMDSHVFRKAAWRLPALADLAVLRFNTRGSTSARGTSEGTFDHGDAERFDVEAALGFAVERSLPHVWVVGWSFGTDLALRWALNPIVQGLILLSPPLRFSADSDLDAWAQTGKPVVALVPEFDDYLRPQAARTRFARIPQAEIIEGPGAKHLWVGEPSVYRVLTEIVRKCAPTALPLPTIWSGPFETWNDLP